MLNKGIFYVRDVIVFRGFPDVKLLRFISFAEIVKVALELCCFPS